MGQVIDWADVKAQLEKNGTSLSALARENGYRPGYFTDARRRITAPVQQIIADALGVHPKSIWPDRYDAHGNPIGARQRGQRTTRPAPGNRQTRSAA